jgi:membrane associated rhomboid family serine protease
MFTHAGLLHLGGNMLFLWIFGNNVEDAMGPVRFVIFYLLAGLAASALQIVFGPDSVTPNLGASGAIAGILGGYLLLYPRAKVVTIVFIIFFFTILELPALLFLGIWFVQQLFFGALTSANTVAGGGVAYWAHVGGFAFGLLLIRVFATRRSSAAEGAPRFPLT